jgi:hypothetical protein
MSETLTNSIHRGNEGSLGGVSSTSLYEGPNAPISANVHPMLNNNPDVVSNPKSTVPFDGSFYKPAETPYPNTTGYWYDLKRKLSA